MDDIKFYLGLTFNFILIIMFGCIAYNIKEDQLALTAFALLTVVGVISFIGKIRDRRFLKRIEEENLSNIAEMNFNQWYINIFDKKGKKYRVAQKMLTPYKMFEEVVKKSETGEEVIKLVKREIKKGGNAESAFKNCREIKY